MAQNHLFSGCIQASIPYSGYRPPRLEVKWLRQYQEQDGTLRGSNYGPATPYQVVLVAAEMGPTPPCFILSRELWDTSEKNQGFHIGYC